MSQSDSIRSKKRLNIEERQAIAEFLLKESKSGSINYGSLKRANVLFHASKSIVQRIWVQTK